MVGGKGAMTRFLDYFGLGNREKEERLCKLHAIEDGVAEVVRLSEKIKTKAENPALTLQKAMRRSRRNPTKKSAK